MPASEREENSLRGEVAIVTGAGRGIGRAIARRLACEGMRVAIAARTPAQLGETLTLIRYDGGQALPFVLDVTDQNAVEQMVCETEQQFGPVDLLVNNAGLPGNETLLWEEPAAEWWRVLEVNLRGPFLCARAVLPGMVERKRGRIINVSSGSGNMSSAIDSAYPVSKAALFRLTDCLAEMTNPHGVSVFAISPGLVHTTMTDNMEMFKGVPESEWMPAEATADLCALIASGAADRLSGRYLHVQADIRGMIEHADEIIENDLYTLRMRQ